MPPRIVTLTPNPSIDRTVALGGPLAARRRPPAGVGHLAGRRQGRQHLPRLRLGRRRHHRGAAGRPGRPLRPTSWSPPAIPHRLVDQRRPGARQPHHHRARRHHHQAQQPRPAASPAVLARPRRDPARPGRRRRLGRARRLAAARCPGRLVRRPGRRPAADSPGSPSTPATRRCGRSSSASTPHRPHLMKPNGEELASFTGGDADELESDPGAAAAAARTLVDRGVDDGPGHPGRPRCRAGHRARAPGTPRRRRPRSSAPSVPATPASSATSSGTCGASTPPHRLALAVAYGSAAAGLPGTTIPQPAQVQPDLVVAALCSADPHLGETDR